MFLGKKFWKFHTTLELYEKCNSSKKCVTIFERKIKIHKKQENKKSGKFRLNKALMVVRMGVEPTTFRLGGGRSIQLSYWRVYQMKL